ncbi:MAG: hypothetical protein HKN80_01725 [Acidimicrobiia bacterium]|nr:hypothetical protein [Acidimicrobiia bacterium]
MKQLVAAFFTLTAIVAGIVLATSLSSSAQEDEGTGDTTATTLAEDLERADRFGFGFRFDGGLHPEIDKFLSCLRDQDIEVPDGADRSFMFDLRGEDFDGLAAAIEECGLPGLDGRFADRFPFDGEFPEGFPFDGEFPDRFPFDGDLPEGFPFHGEFPEGFPFDGEGLTFHMGPMGVDRDELAECLTGLDGFNSVERVREKLDECLPAPPEFGDFEGFHGFRHHGLPFGGHGFFDFDSEDMSPELEDTSA